MSDVIIERSVVVEGGVFIAFRGNHVHLDRSSFLAELSNIDWLEASVKVPVPRGLGAVVVMGDRVIVRCDQTDVPWRDSSGDWIYDDDVRVLIDMGAIVASIGVKRD